MAHRPRDGCGTKTVNAGTYDLDTSAAGDETASRWYAGCASGIDVQLDVIAGGQHVPPLDPNAVGTHSTGRWPHSR